MGWRWFAAAFGAAAMMAGGAQAADTLAYGPAPAWVKPPALDTAAAPAGAAAVAVLMQDHEVRYGADYDEVYDEAAIKALTPAGLSALGTISRTWNPATTAMTINRLEIIRGGQVIDALAPDSPAGSDPFLVLRRETNLSLATLDGALTGTKQLNGLRVGDILHIATTSRYHDPLLGGILQDFAQIAGPIAHVQMRLIWPTGRPVRWKATEGFGEPSITQTADGVELLLDRRDLAPLVAPEGAPGRYQRPGLVQVTDLADWQAVSRLFAPLYDKASTLSADSPLKAQAQAIRAANPTKAGQAAAALKLVQDEVRYVALAMGEGGLNPAAADLTWSRRFGDCKGKTALLLALLRELGISAQPALVSADGADGLDQMLPSIDFFDHVMVRAVVDNKTYWLDGTRQGDGALADLPVPDMDWALPLSIAGSPLERLVVPLPATPQEEKLITLDLSGGKSDKVPAKVAYSLRRDEALGARLGMAQIDPSVAEATLQGVLKQEFNVDFTKASMTDKDGVVTINGEGTFDTGWYTDGATRRPALSVGGGSYGYYEVPDRSIGLNTDAPILLDYPNYQETRTVIILPGDGDGFTPRGADSDVTAGGVRITRTTKVEGRTVIIDQTTRTVQTEAALSDLKTAVARFKAAPTSDSVVLLAPRDFAATAGQLAQAVAVDPTNAAALVDLGSKAADQGRYTEAIRQYDAAIKVQPGYARAWRARAWVEKTLAQWDSALADADKAISLDPQEAYGPYYRGLVYSAKRDYAKAVDDYTAALKLDPTLTEVLEDRAAALLQLKRYAEAQADVDAGLKLDPDNTQLRATGVDIILAALPAGQREPGYLVAAIQKGYAGVTGYDAVLARGRFLMAAGAPEDGLADLTAAIKLDPQRPEAYGTRGAYYLSHDKAGDGARDLAQLVALSPTAASYLTRGSARLAVKDYAGARADFTAAAAKDPDSPTPSLRLATVAQQQGDIAGALAQLDKVIAAHPDLPAAYRQQAQLYMGQKNYVEAAHSYERIWAQQPADLDLAISASNLYELAKDYPQALAVMDKAVAQSPTTPVLLNDRCFLKATRDIQASTAVADCDQALKLDPNRPGYLDSRGMAYLRAGQWDKAIADYDAALKLQPVLPESSYGRGVARARKGDAAGSSADIADAKRARPDIDKTFADYGLTP